MNDLQKKELEILRVFVEICDKLDLKYYLVCGSALGAVKYQGFIPWDDDIDVALPRLDYERFLLEAPKFLPEWLFIQNYRTDPEFPKVFTKLRDSRTTYIEANYQKLNINHGIFIDIFALDGYPDDAKEIVRFEKKKRMYLRFTSCSLLPENHSFKSMLLRTVLRILFYHKNTAKYLAKYESMIRSYGASDVYCNYGNFRGVIEKTHKEIYGEGAEAVFEGIHVFVPSQYDLYLREKYGDYTKDPPIEEQVGHHYYSMMDTNVSYKASTDNC